MPGENLLSRDDILACLEFSRPTLVAQERSSGAEISLEVGTVSRHRSKSRIELLLPARKALKRPLFVRPEGDMHKNVHNI